MQSFLNKCQANQTVPPRLTACQLGPSTVANALLENNPLLCSLSEWLHATCHATVGPRSSPHAQHSSQTKLLWQFLKPPAQVAATSFPSQPATVYVERHTTQHQLCLPRGLHKPKHKGNQSPAPILHVTVLVRTSWPRKHKVGRGSKSTARSSRTSSLHHPQHLHVVVHSTRCTRTTSLTATTALHALCQQHSTTTAHTTCIALLHTPCAAQHIVDVVVTTTGGIEEDLIKCLAPTYKGDFSLPGAYLRSKGLNRIGNLLVPNDNYCKFEDWIIPIFDEMLQEQFEEKILWTPSKVIARLGKEINDPSSYLYWASKNDIPVFCPGLTDGSLGDMLYFHSFRKPGLVIDVVQDIRAVNSEAVHASPRKTGMIILGGGLPKHHICNANMMRNGADYAVFINTAQEFDGSDSGARPDEAVSWGKIRGSAKTVKLKNEVSVIEPKSIEEGLVVDDGVRYFV
ncbi:hypothetical protein MRB53_011031 [Persea americana]|uniref:Uncharacterized protein n=1 Tax=Persea americana TaxID=3435 RepID=A0ACC2LUP9_PERAE|nr:hypothetical protein MRB53_011031 [Persea americana]